MANSPLNAALSKKFKADRAKARNWGRWPRLIVILLALGLILTTVIKRLG